MSCCRRCLPSQRPINRGVSFRLEAQRRGRCLGDASRTTFVPLAGGTWTFVPTLSSGAVTISRPIFCGAIVFAQCSFNGFEMDWPVADGPDAGRSILVDLSVTMFDASGNVVASTSGNEFRLFTPLPEPSTASLFATALGLMSLILVLHTLVPNRR